MMNFDTLAQSIQQTQTVLQQEAIKAVISMTVRNWLVGFYIVDFEQKDWIERLTENIYCKN